MCNAIFNNSWQINTNRHAIVLFSSVIRRRIFVHIKFEICNKIGCILGPRNE